MGGAVFSEETERMVKEARAQAASRKRKRKQPPPPPSMVMRLHILRGSLSGWKDPGDACCAGGGPGPAMDPAVWSRLPDDIMWRVLRFVSVVKRFQLQSVSRKWQRELTTSPRLRCCNAITSSELRVVACATPFPAWVDKRYRRTDGEADPSLKPREAVDVDLSFVPSWFWEPGRSSYSVVAAGDGLVCISNDMDFTSDYRHWDAMTRRRAKPILYCVLNPLTRTCVVLPPPPFPEGRPNGWLAPTAAGVITAYNTDKARGVATFDLAAVGPGAGAASGWRWTPTPAAPGPPIPVQCAGETFRYSAGRLEIHDVLAPVPAGSATEAEAEAPAVASPDGPSVALLGLDATAIEYWDEEVQLVTHRGALFFVAHLRNWRSRRDAHDERDHPEFVAGVWRLGRGGGGDRSVAWWEPVSVLRDRDAEPLVARPGFESSPYNYPLPYVNRVTGAFSVLDLLCCVLVMDHPSIDHACDHCVLGFQLDTGEWERVLGYEEELGLVYRDLENGQLVRARPVELRPDLYLAVKPRCALETGWHGCKPCANTSVSALEK